MISPWMFYLVGLCVELKGILFFLCLIFYLLATVNWALWVDQSKSTYLCGESDDPRAIELKANVKKLLRVAVVLTILCILFPTKETCYGMVAAYYITPDVIAGGRESVIQFVKDIAEAISSK